MNGLSLTNASLSNMESSSHSLSTSVISVIFNGKVHHNFMQSKMPCQFCVHSEVNNMVTLWNFYGKRLPDSCPSPPTWQQWYSLTQTRQLNLGKSRHDFKQTLGGCLCPTAWRKKAVEHVSLGCQGCSQQQGRSPDTTLVMLTQAVHGNLREHKSITGHTSIWLCPSPAWCGRAGRRSKYVAVMSTVDAH